MRPVRLVGKHLAFGMFAIWGVVTVVFGLFALTDEQTAYHDTGYGIDSTGDPSLLELYRSLLWRMGTLDWGVATGGEPDANTYAYHAGDAVMPLVVGALGRTMSYVIPAIFLGLSIAVTLGLYAALHPDSWIASITLSSTYLVFAVPTFWLGAIALSLAIEGTIAYSPVLFEHVLPVVLVTTALLGGPPSYVRAHALEYVSEPFVKLVEAKGANGGRLAVHVLRNAAIPVFSMVFTETLGLLVLSIFVVEVVFAIEGIGLVLLGATNSRDVPVLLGGVILVVVVGVLANLLQDISYSVLDPRVEMGS